MSDSPEQTPYELLLDIEQQVQSTAVDLPSQSTDSDLWRGIGFSLFGRSYIAPFEQVDEIQYLPEVSRVPGVKNWLQGIANVRGRLMSLVDLGIFLGERPSGNAPAPRVLAVRDEDLYSGLVVEEVLGMHSFAQNQMQSGNEEPVEALKPFIQGYFEDKSRRWAVVDLYRLAQAPDFLDVAV